MIKVQGAFPEGGAAWTYGLLITHILHDLAVLHLTKFISLVM